MFHSDEGPTLETLDFTIRIGTWQYTNLFILRFVSLLCLRSTLRLVLVSLLAIYNPEGEVRGINIANYISSIYSLHVL